jgi:hypothetical protein
VSHGDSEAGTSGEAKPQLYEIAKERDIAGRSKMGK